jgi:uncharacterized protein
MEPDVQGRAMPKQHHVATTEKQLRTVRFLGSPSTHDGHAVKCIATHISHIFLAGNRAYKLKRAVRTNFLDFTTLAGREAACRREIEVNSGVAAGLYRGVIPVVRQSDGLALGGEGEVVDWVVAMNRFERTQEFDVLAAAGRLDIGLIEALADCVAQMHCRAARTPDFGGSERVAATIAQIYEMIASLPCADDLRDLLEAWRNRAKAALSRNAGYVDARRRHGYVRRCHGDLHLGNICIFEGRPTPFDALEFNEEMASIDVLYDIAFTAMDMIERDLQPLANAFLNRYLGATRDYSGLVLLPLFISMRAAVRALVAASRPVADRLEPTARDRLVFAGKALDPAGAPKLIAIGGLSGSGKSTIARRIAPGLAGHVGAVVLRSDVARKRMIGVAPEHPLGDAGYQPEVTARVYAQLHKDARRTLMSGSSAILDATYVSMGDRAQAKLVARKAGVEFHGIWLTCGPAELHRRILDRGADASDASPEVLNRQLGRDPGANDWVAVNSEAGFENTVKHVLEEVQHIADRHALV